MPTSMTTVLDAPGRTRRRLVQAAAAATVVPQAAWAAAVASRGAPGPGRRLELPPAGAVRVSGQVVDAAGLALAGQRVVLIDDQGRIAHADRCDADGRFLLAAAGVPGRLRVDLDGARGTHVAGATALTDGDGTLRCAVRLQPAFG